MQEHIHAMHLRAGEAYGRDATCGSKIDYKSEQSADKAASAMSKKSSIKVLEAYPCFWCKGWHIGRAMTQEEMLQFST